MLGDRKMFFRVVSKAFWRQRGRVMASLAALTVGATLSSAFLSLYFDLPRKMTAEFRSLGANLLLAPRGDAQTFPETVYAQLALSHPQIPRLPWLYAVGRVQGRDAILGGTEQAGLAALNPGWKAFETAEQRGAAASLETFLGTRPPLSSSGRWLLAGEQVASFFGWRAGQAVQLEYGGKAVTLPLGGIVSAGGSEDSQLFLPLAALQDLTGLQDQLSLVQVAVPGPAAQVEQVRQQFAAQLPAVEVRPLRQVVESEARVVLKVRGLMFGLTAIVLCIVILSVMTTVSGLVLNRQREIGLMKALGGADSAVSLLFVAETACFALLAGVAGYLLGFGLAQWAAQRIFQSSLEWRWEVLPAVLGVTVAVALAATAFPVYLIRRLEPAVILRGN